MNTLTHIKNIKQNMIKVMADKKSAHIGGSLSSIDVMTVLYESFLKYDFKNLSEDRDRFILSKGHCAIAQYAVLAEFGIISQEEFMSFCENGGDFPTHIVKNLSKGLEVTSGSLGMGLPYGIGVALAMKKKNIDKKVFVLVGNGELNEGSNWEALMFAGLHKLNNVVLIVDDNKLQLDGPDEDALILQNIEPKIKAFDWYTKTIDGHNIEEITEALNSTINQDKPTAIIANTIKGKDVEFMENQTKWHHSKMTTEEFEQAMKNLEVL